MHYENAIQQMLRSRASARAGTNSGEYNSDVTVSNMKITTGKDSEFNLPNTLRSDADNPYFTGILQLHQAGARARREAVRAVHGHRQGPGLHGEGGGPALLPVLRVAAGARPQGGRGAAERRRRSGKKHAAQRLKDKAPVVPMLDKNKAMGAYCVVAHNYNYSSAPIVHDQAETRVGCVEATSLESRRKCVLVLKKLAKCVW